MHGRKALVRVGAAVVIVFALLAIAGCTTGGGGTATTGSTSTSTASAVKIALLLPETKTARYETQDKPLFEAKVKELAPDAQIIYSNANQDSAQQQSQADAALTNGANVLVLDAVDSTAAAAVAQKAKAAGVPVIAYDRLINGAPIDNYISFDNEQVGKLQATALLAKLKAMNPGKKPTIVMINGSPTDNNATLFKKGAHSVLDGQVNIAAEYDTPDWSPDQAQTEMDQAITKLGKNGFQGVYAANDGTAGGAIAAMKAAGIDPATRPTTGQDAELAAIQRIILGEQYMTVYKAIAQEASAAAVAAVSLAKKEPLPSTLPITQVDNGAGQVPSVLLTPVAVTKDNIKDTVVADKFWTLDAILNSPQIKAAAAKLGLQ